eukprot:SAG31_NODE_783_length_12123_cov_5.272130_9_plen_151_part_00
MRLELAAQPVRCPGDSNLGHQPPYMISNSSGAPVLQFGTTQAVGSVQAFTPPLLADVPPRRLFRDGRPPVRHPLSQSRPIKSATDLCRRPPPTAGMLRSSISTEPMLLGSGISNSGSSSACRSQERRRLLCNSKAAPQCWEWTASRPTSA